jgi:hypothetical protein
MVLSSFRIFEASRAVIRPYPLEQSIILFLSNVWVIINRKPGLRLESSRIFEMDELAFCLPEKKDIHIRTFALPCHFGICSAEPSATSVKLNLYEPTIVTGARPIRYNAKTDQNYGLLLA